MEFPPRIFRPELALLSQKKRPKQIANESPPQPANAPAIARIIDPAGALIKMKAAPNPPPLPQVPFLPQNKFPARPAPANAPVRRAPIRAAELRPAPTVRKVAAQAAPPIQRTYESPSAPK